MAFNIEDHLARMDRRVTRGERDGQETAIVHAGRTYETDVVDLWDALTNADRIARWFLPISGDLRQGGRYQFEGNAGGTIQECVEPERVKMTWEFAGGVSWLTVRLTANANGTRLELEHEAHLIPDFSDVYGPGAVGVGWDGGFLGMAIHVKDPTVAKPPEADPEWPMSPEGKSFFGAAAAAWGGADADAGTPVEEAMARAETTRKFYTGEGPGMGEESAEGSAAAGGDVAEGGSPADD